jgi:rod shape-determining protein MreC
MSLTTVDREPGAIRSASPGFRLLLLTILAVTLMVVDHDKEHLTNLRKALSVLIYPIELLVSAPFDISHDLSESLQTREELEAANRRLNQEALVQNARLQRMAALEAENARLRALLDSTEKVGDNILIAEIVSVDMNPFRNMIVVNKGSQDGVYVGQALIDADGIIGQITRDKYFTAEAMLVTDVDHAIPVELARNRLRTIAVGTGELNQLSLPFLPSNADVTEGDLFVSSGLGGTFPPGYPVGTIREIERTTGQPFLKVVAEPAAALNRIREVLLLTPEDQTRPANVVATEVPENTLPKILAEPAAPNTPTEAGTGELAAAEATAASEETEPAITDESAQPAGSAEKSTAEAGT